MKTYDAIIIGFGKGGKTLAGFLGKVGKKVAVIEKSDKMYGGTCINIGCIPTKFLVHNSKKILNRKLSNFEEKAAEYKKVISEKRKLTEALRIKNYNLLNENKNIDIYNGVASFTSENIIEIRDENKLIDTIKGEKIFINTGATTVIPNIEGLEESKRVYTSTSIMELEELPRELIIVGGGYIGLEFASIYASFGARVTVVEFANKVAGREDRDVAENIKEILENKGVKFILNSNVKTIKDENDKVIVSYINKETEEEIKINGDGVLVAVGRKPNIEGLNLEKIGVETTERGAILVDDKLRTNKKNIWAIGDVNGGLQFTYISLDDFRIIKDNLFGENKRSTKDRKEIPYSVFIEPNLSRVGLSEEEAIKEGYEIKVAKLQVNTIPRAKIIGETQGMMKAIVDAKTNKILGCTLLSLESSELINIISIAMKANLDYTFIKDNIFTHPSMGEALNDLFSLI